MTKVEDQLRQLRISGYYDAADIIERLMKSPNVRAELEYLEAFAKQSDFEQEPTAQQLRSLWTAFCFHADLITDTAEYDHRLRAIWCSLVRPDRWPDFKSFDLFMGEYLA